MQLEIGKTYTDGFGQKVKIVHASSNVQAYLGVMLPHEVSYWYYPDGVALDENRTKIGKTALGAEYREPVVHKAIVVWFKDDGYVWSCSYQPSHSMMKQTKLTHEIFRQTIEFEEK